MHGMPVAIASAHDNAHHRINDPDGVTHELWDYCKALAGGTGAAIHLLDAVDVSLRDTAEGRRTGPEQAASRCLELIGDCDRHSCGILPEEAQRIHRTLLRDPRVCCWEICEVNPRLDTLNSIADISPGVYSVVLHELDRRHPRRHRDESDFHSSASVG
jgi:hypothetical protein